MRNAKHNSLAILLVAVVAASCSFAFAADSHYRWNDKHGNPVHSDRPPPPGTDYEVVSTTSSLVRRVNSAEGVVPAELEPSYRNEFELVDTAKPQSIKKNPEYCERAQENLSTLDTFARIRIRDDQGEYRYIDEDEKEAQREQARKLIDIHCE